MSTVRYLKEIAREHPSCGPSLAGRDSPAYQSRLRGPTHCSTQTLSEATLWARKEAVGPIPPGVLLALTYFISLRIIELASLTLLQMTGR